MAKRTYSVAPTVDVPLVTTAETVVATVPGVTTDRPGQLLRLAAEYTITLGASTTAVTHRLRRDSLTGAVVNEATTEQIDTAAGSTEGHEISGEDSFAGEVAGQTYVLTVQQVGATANGAVLRSTLRVDTD